MGRRLFILILLGLTLGLFFVSGALAQGKIKIGIIRYSDELGYPEGVKGVIEQLKKEGFDESKVIFDSRSADSSKEKVTEITKEFLEKKMDLIVAVGTSSVVGVYKETKDIPIVCAMIFDPVGAGVAKSWESSGTNVTGASSWVDMSAIVNALKQVCPAKQIGVLYNEEEKNSVLQLEEFRKLQGKMGFTVIGANVTKPEETGEVTRSLVGRVDSIFISGSSTVSKGLGAILEVTNKSNIATAAHTQDKLEKGVLLTLSANSFRLGELAGKKVALVLRGAKPSDIPIETLKTYDLAVNLKTADAIGAKVSAKRLILKGAAKVIGE